MIRIAIIPVEVAELDPLPLPPPPPPSPVGFIASGAGTDLTLECTGSAEERLLFRRFPNLPPPCKDCVCFRALIALRRSPCVIKPFSCASNTTSGLKWGVDLEEDEV